MGLFASLRGRNVPGVPPVPRYTSAQISACSRMVQAEIDGDFESADWIAREHHLGDSDVIEMFARDLISEDLIDLWKHIERAASPAAPSVPPASTAGW